MRAKDTNKIRSRVDLFVKNCDEFDEQLNCYVAWLPRPTFDRVIRGPLDTVWAAVLDENDNLSILVGDEWSETQSFVEFGSLPFSVQKMLVREWEREAMED